MTFDAVEILLRELVDTSRCPWCGAVLRGPVCVRCGVDLSGPAGHDLADRSRRAAEALRERQAALWAVRHRVPSLATPGTAPDGTVRPTVPDSEPTVVPASAPRAGLPVYGRSAWTGPAAAVAQPAPRPGPRLTEAALPTVLGAVGAALVAVGGLVFAYSGLIADPAVRRTVLVLVTLAAGAATLVLHRRGFGASAGAVGGLTAVLGLVAVHLVSGTTHGPARSVALAGAGLAWAVVLAGAGRRLGLRVWSGAGLVVAPVAVTTLGSVWDRWTGTAALAVALTLLLAVATAAGCAAVERRWRTGRRTVESVVLTVEAAVAVLVATVSGLVGSVGLLPDAAESVGRPTPGLPGLTFVGLGLAAAALGRLRPGWWTGVAGAYLVGGAGWTTLLLALGSDDNPQGLTVFGTTVVTVALVWVGLSLVARVVPGPVAPDGTRQGPGRFRSLLAGGWLVTAVLALPLGAVTLAAVGTVLTSPGGPGATRPVSHEPPSLDWLSGWLAGAWLALGLAWAWYAVLPRVLTSRHAPSWGSPRLDPADVLVVVGQPGTEAPLSTWAQTRPRPGVVLRSARLRSTGQPVPLDQVDDPWRVAPASLPAAAGALAPVGVGAALGTAGLLAGPVWATLTVWLLSAAASWTADRALSRQPAPADGVDLGAELPGREGDSPLSRRSAPADGPGPWFTRFAVRPGLWVSGLGLLVLAAAYSWWSRPATLVVGLVVVVATVAWSRQAASVFRPLLVGLGYAYALVVAGFALSWYPWGWTADWAATAGSLAVVSAVVALVLGRAHRHVSHPVYFTLLGVGAVPWLLALTTMLQARTWWAAGAGTAVLAVEAAVLSSRTRPQPAVVRILATVGLVPTAAAIAVNVTPQVTTGSGAPVVLPVVSVLAVVGAVIAEPWANRLAHDPSAPPTTASPDAAPAAAPTGATPTAVLPATTQAAPLDPPAAGPTAVGWRPSHGLAARVRVALETSALGTAVVAELLAVVRASAGPGISLAVCAITGAGAVYMATRPDRRFSWWLAWLSWSGVLWSALAWGSVGLVEAYTAPPGLAAAVVAAWLVVRRPALARLAAAGLLLALAPTGVLLVAGQAVAARAAALTGAAVLLGIGATVVRRRPAGPGTPSRTPLLPPAAVGIVGAGLGPMVLAWHVLAVVGSSGTPSVRFGRTWFADAVDELSHRPAGLFAVAVGLTLVSAALAAWAGLVAGWSTGGPTRHAWVMTWRMAPAAVLAALGPAVAAPVLDRDQVPGLGWALVAAWLVGAVLVGTGAVAARRSADVSRGLWAPTGLAPAWVLWGLALVTVAPLWVLGVVPVEWSALPYGAALVVTGLALTGALPRTRVTAWATPRPDPTNPSGRTLSPTLAMVPGVVTVLVPSTSALVADPATWRAIMLVLLALAFMLLGARKMWKAPLGLGIADMAVVVVVVFATAQVSTTPWLITLLATGGLLLTLAVYAERRRNATAQL